MSTQASKAYSVVSPTEPEVTIAHTKILLARRWEDQQNRTAQTFIGNYSLLFTQHGINRTTIYYISTYTNHPSFIHTTQLPAMRWHMLFTGIATHLPQFDNVCESRPESIFTKFSSHTLCTTGRKRVVVNANKCLVLFQRADR